MKSNLVLSNSRINYW